MRRLGRRYEYLQERGREPTGNAMEWRIASASYGGILAQMRERSIKVKWSLQSRQLDPTFSEAFSTLPVSKYELEGATSYRIFPPTTPIGDWFRSIGSSFLATNKAINPIRRYCRCSRRRELQRPCANVRSSRFAVNRRNLLFHKKVSGCGNGVEMSLFRPFGSRQHRCAVHDRRQL